MHPLVGVAWETFQESYSAPPQVASEEKGKSNKGLGGKELEINLFLQTQLDHQEVRESGAKCQKRGRTP